MTINQLRPRQTTWHVTRAAALAIGALCAALALANALEVGLMSVAHGSSVPWLQLLALNGPRWVLLAGLMSLVLILARRFPVWPIEPRAFAAHVAGFMIVLFAHAVVYTIVLRRVGTDLQFPFGYHVAGTMLRTMPILVLLYAATLGIARLADVTLDRYARELHASQLQAELSAARLAALRAQLHPHFLYNALHAIAALIEDDQKKRALVATEHLADLLRAAFRDDGRDLIPLAEEMQLVERYLALQQMRFADRLVVSYRVAPETSATLIPPLLLQPIVENAVQHGLATAVGTVTVCITSSVVRDKISIVVENDGAIVNGAWSPRSDKGVGIPNTRGRLNTIYGPEAEFRVVPREHGGVTATLLFPLQRG